MLSNFWTGKRVLLTGATGFKGSWLVMILRQAGAIVRGVGLTPDTEPSLCQVLNLPNLVQIDIHDICDAAWMKRCVSEWKPDVVFHLAAQPIVSRSYADPFETYRCNVMGTVSVLDSLRFVEHKCACVLITTDKVYANKGWEWGYRETDELGGSDPYSASKSCCELVAKSYIESFFGLKSKVIVATARAGNVIGGGDWALDRLVPDVIRATSSNKPLKIRAPKSVRPWQHVLEPLSGYLCLAESIWLNELRDPYCWNFGPDSSSVVDVETLIGGLLRRLGESSTSVVFEAGDFKESTMLLLDSSRASRKLGWKPVLSFDETLDLTASWYRRYQEKEDIHEVTVEQILGYFEKREREPSAGRVARGASYA